MPVIGEETIIGVSRARPKDHPCAPRGGYERSLVRTAPSSNCAKHIDHRVDIEDGIMVGSGPVVHDAGGDMLGKQLELRQLVAERPEEDAPGSGAREVAEPFGAELGGTDRQ
jgi:hypothetical protein